MNNFIKLLTLLATACILSACTPAGLIYEDVGHPPILLGPAGPNGGTMGFDPNLNASDGPRSWSKVGTACSYDVLKLVAWGDATQAAAAKQAGINEVVGLDVETEAVLLIGTHGSASRSTATDLWPLNQEPGVLVLQTFSHFQAKSR